MAGEIDFGSNTAMASGSSPKAEDRKIVLLGKAGAGKNRVARFILGDTKLNEESEECLLYEGEHAGRRICIVNTPGWDRVSIECTTEKMKKEIVRSVTLCPPGPHALVLVLPINADDELSVNELKSASRHMELLSKRVWNHTVVLFLCEGDVEESTIKEHIHKAEKLLEKCRGRHCVMRLSDSKTQVHGLLEEIDSMVEESLDDFFLPQVYYEVMQSKITQDIRELEKRYEDKIEMLKQGYQNRLSMYKNQTEGEPLLKRRRGSIDGTRPSFAEDENQEDDTSTFRKKYQDELLALAKYCFKPAGLLLFAMIGALIGSVVGSNYGVVGSGSGIVIGIIVAIPLGLCLIKSASLARQSSSHVEDKKTEQMN
ncbi:GTPase IMAP family member 4-like [Tachysurus fulvidraco]|uniref:GTPase IMAP family member 4-like n=1 Tax=Tachysurus fulvidraco TaxID=1234273 RepID=UPI001FEF8074|nr:GTPase IMAP family member 4-like [Tachysurus fulvidraco]